MKIQRATLVIPLVATLALVYSFGALASAPAAPAVAPAAESALITATGTAVIPGDSTTVFPQTVYAMVQANAGVADVEAVFTQVTKQLAAMSAALEKVGLPADAIHTTPPALSAQKMGSFMVTGSLFADVSDVKMLAAAIGAASASGATQVNAGGGKQQPNMTARPADAALAKGMADAIASAHAVASAMASATGTKLGAVHSISANQLYAACCGPQGTGWNLQVTVSYELARP